MEYTNCPVIPCRLGVIEITADRASDRLAKFCAPQAPGFRADSV